MRVQDLSDTDILNYLMISEFNEGLSPDEFKFLLYKFRYFYRMSYGRNESLKIEVDKLKMDLESNIKIYNTNVNNLNFEKAKFERRYNQIKDKKLTWKERIKGKIIINEDEIDGI